MKFTKGNTLWQLKSKHGRDMIFNTPEMLLQAAYEYFAWCDKHPWYKNEQLKKPQIQKDKNGKEKLITTIKLPTQRPYTLSGLCIYLGVNQVYWQDFQKNKSFTSAFAEVVSHVEQIVRTQKFEGAAVGAFNANIIARDLGLVDKKDVTTEGESLNKGYYDFLRQRRTVKSPDENQMPDQ